MELTACYHSFSVDSVHSASGNSANETMQYAMRTHTRAPKPGSNSEDTLNNVHASVLDTFFAVMAIYDYDATILLTALSSIIFNGACKV